MSQRGSRIVVSSRSEEGDRFSVEEFFRTLPKLETSRLLLRKITLEDAQDMFAYACDAEVSRQVLWQRHNTLMDSVAYVKAMVRKYQAGEVTEWCLQSKVSGSMIGTCGFVSMDPDHDRAEIGYALARAYWNTGLISEAVHRVLDFGFEELGLNRVEARVTTENFASQRVLEKAGFRLEGELRQQLFMKGRYRDVRMYALLRSDV